MNWYQKKLRDPRWQKRRLEILDRDEFSCTNCGDKETELHVHHAIYLKGKDPWEYEDEHLITLCAPCHEVQTHAAERLKRLLAANPCMVPTIVWMVEGFLVGNFDKEYERPAGADQVLGFSAGVLAAFAHGSVNACQDLIQIGVEKGVGHRNPVTDWFMGEPM